MSLFGGIMKEYPYFGVDNFMCSFKIYFLSHLHTDHIRGLHQLKESDEFVIYCSAITKQLIINTPSMAYLYKHLVAKSIYDPFIIVLENDQSVQVTLCPAGHCLGSVMFLFEGFNGCVLYTGDFRLDNCQFNAMRPFHLGIGKKHFHAIYADTTFFQDAESMLSIPTRYQSCQKVIQLCSDWLQRSTNYVVQLHTSCKYSYDYVFTALREKFSTKIHVSPSTWSLYEGEILQDLRANFTKYPNETRIHACFANDKKGNCLPCGYQDPNGQAVHVLRIKLSTQWFKASQFRQLHAVLPNNYHRVCFCFHPSSSELRDFVLYLQPRRLVACVAENTIQLKKVQENLEQLLLAYLPQSVAPWQPADTSPTESAAVNELTQACRSALKEMVQSDERAVPMKRDRSPIRPSQSSSTSSVRSTPARVTPPLYPNSQGNHIRWPTFSSSSTAAAAVSEVICIDLTFSD